MADHTGIQWTDATWNPIAGCSIVSPACTNCYAMAQAARIVRCAAGLERETHYAGTIETVNGRPVWTGAVHVAPDHILTQPLRWRRPRRIFVNSMSDLFHEAVADETIDRIFAVMALAPQHTFQVLTKRPKRMRAYMMRRCDRGRWPAMDMAALMAATGRWNTPALDLRNGWPLPNVWLGVTAERQKEADERIPILLDTPAEKRFVSVEPMLGPIDLRRIAMLEIEYETGFHYQDVLRAGSWSPKPFFRPSQPDEPQVYFTNHSDTNKLDWVICGGESGPGARTMVDAWARDLIAQCKDARVPAFMKQMGGIRKPFRPIPDDMLVREFPDET